MLLSQGLDIAFQSGLTPLIIDSSSDNRLGTFFSYSSNVIVLDAEAMEIEKSLRHTPVEVLMEQARVKLVCAMKLGKTLLVNMNNSAADFIATFNDCAVEGLDCRCESAEMSQHSPRLLFVSDGKAYFPTEALQRGGALLLQPSWAQRLFRDHDLEAGLALCREGFNVIVLSYLILDDIDECLFSGQWGLPPRQNFRIVHIVSERLSTELFYHIHNA
jgi:hypothetical protein